MKDEENIVKKLEEQKITTWKNNYIDYYLLKNELDSINENNELIGRRTIDIDGIGQIFPEFELLKKGNFDDNSSSHESLKPPSKIKNDNIKKVQRLSINRSKKEFINLLDEQVKDFRTFYKNKEKLLYEKINLQIKNNNDAKTDDKRMEIIIELKYLSSLCIVSAIDSFANKFCTYSTSSSQITLLSKHLFCMVFSFL